MNPINYLPDHDKLGHFFVGYILMIFFNIVFSMTNRKKIVVFYLSIFCVLLFSIIKECLDASLHKGYCSLIDIMFSILPFFMEFLKNILISISLRK